jgi:hypothetical protein
MPPFSAPFGADWLLPLIKLPLLLASGVFWVIDVIGPIGNIIAIAIIIGLFARNSAGPVHR